MLDLQFTINTKRLRQKQQAVHAALCNSINTPVAMTEIMDLVTKTNVYLSSKVRGVNLHVVEKVAKWITGMIKVCNRGMEFCSSTTGNKAGKEIEGLLCQNRLDDNCVLWFDWLNMCNVF